LEQRRARRIIWTVRLTFLSAAALAAVLLLAGRSSGASTVWLDGTTSAGTHVQVRLDDGQPVRLGINLPMRCPHGTWAVSWWTRDGLHVRETTTHQYRYHDQNSRRTITLDAQLEDGTVHGTVTAVEHFDEPGYGRYTCESGPIRFAARAQ
jgi:hypothetical protein